MTVSLLHRLKSAGVNKYLERVGMGLIYSNICKQASDGDVYFTFLVAVKAFK